MAPTRGARPATAPSSRSPHHERGEESIVRPEWIGAFPAGNVFGEPPAPKLGFLNHPQLGWQNSKDERKKIWVTDVGKFRTLESVKLVNGVPETNAKGQPPRPRSALILGKEFADLRQKPRAESRTQPEAIYLLHCDSTDTAIARGKDFWMPERALASKPLGAPREWLADGRLGRPLFSKKYGGAPQLFQDIADEPLKAAARAKLHAEAEARRAAQPPRPPPAKPPQAWIDPERRALQDVPPLRRRRQCPPQLRVRTSPRLIAVS